jgi:hypothetical protein
LILNSCGPKPRPGADLPVPYDLTVDAQSERAVVYWSIDRAQNRPISGYNIYLSEKPLEEYFSEWEENRPEPYNHAPYPGDTDGDNTRESFEFAQLQNGKTYYVSVRTVGISGAESDASEEIEFTPLARGEFIISSNHSSQNGGFNFEKGVSTPARDLRCDVYLYAKRDEVGLSSPSRLSAGLRKTAFAGSDENYSETVKIKQGDRLVVKTSGGRARIRIEKISRKGLEAEAVIEYEFFPHGYGD